MKKIIKISILVILILLITGCSKVTSNITYSSDGKIKEEVVFEEPNSNISNDDSRIEYILSSAVDNYSLPIKTMNYDYKIEKGKDKSKIIFNNTYNDICTWAKKNMFSQYIYKKIDCHEENDYYVLKNITPHIQYCSSCSDWPSLDDVSLSIKLPLKAEENNADTVSKNTYTWRFDKYTPDSKSIYLKINKKSFNDKMKELTIKNENRKKMKNIYAYIFISFIILGLIIFIFSLYKKHKENKMEY